MDNQLEQMPFVAIIGDIKQSRSLSNRSGVQRRFTTVLESINEKYADDIASQFMVTLGDSFQGLLKTKQTLLTIIFEIEMAMSPVDMRFGIGMGEVSTSIQRENSMEIDGTAYHRARKMIETIEAKESKYTNDETNIMICSGEEDNQTDRLLNSIFSLATALKSKWTDRQKEIIYAYYTHGANQYKAAEALNIGQSSVNKALNTAKFYTYQTALANVSSFLSQKKGEGNK